LIAKVAAAMWPELPTPELPYWYRPGGAFISATNSCGVRAETPLWVMARPIGMKQVGAIGVRSRTGRVGQELDPPWARAGRASPAAPAESSRRRRGHAA
jgi:hypothetical protein